MRTIYYLTLSVKRGNAPAVLRDIEVPDIAGLNEILLEIHNASLGSYGKPGSIVR